MEAVKVLLTGDNKGRKLGKRMIEVNQHFEYREKCHWCKSSCWYDHTGDVFLGLVKVQTSFSGALKTHTIIKRSVIKNDYEPTLKDSITL